MKSPHPIRVRPHGNKRRRVIVTTGRWYNRRSYLADATVDGLTGVLHDRTLAAEICMLFHSVK